MKVFKKMANNIWQHVKSIPLDALQAKVEYYQHNGTGMGLHIANVPGPICTCMIVVPTEASNDMGLAHTLEHLVFLGSKSIPYRGYLDIFANRCLATGTNAYTAEDHTCFNVFTAGFEGMLNILPVFLDYILHPELSEANFDTEIYHIDGEGREMGVVYCEMLGRENTEDDLKDYTLNRLLFAGTGYSHFVGGKTEDIAKLNNNMIREFHKQQYDPATINILLQGQMDHSAVFKALESVTITPNEENRKNNFRPFADPILPLSQNKSEIVNFPSEDENVGSVSIAWQGPPINDVHTILALYVVFRYLQDTAASPLQQRFVERSTPLTSNIDFGIRFYRVSQMVLEFTGVPTNFKKSSQEEDGTSSSASGDEESGSSEEDSGSESESESDDDEEKEEAEEEGFDSDLLAPNSMYRRFEALLQKITKSEIPLDAMKNAVRRHRVKYSEGLEDDPNDFVTELILPNLLYSLDGFNYGDWFRYSSVLDDLENKDQQFWTDLLQKWILSNPRVEVIMKPDKDMANRMSEESKRKIQERVAALGEEGLTKLKEKLSKSMKESTIPLPKELARFPVIPDSDKIPILPTEEKFITNLPHQPFPIQICTVNTQFYHVRLVFHIKNLPDELRPYLSLFQELLFETDVQISDQQRMSYKEVTMKLHDEVVNHECGVGFGSSTFTCDMLPEIFYIYGLSELPKLDSLCNLLIDILFGATFPVKRILTTVSNILSDAHEESRDGSIVAGTLCAGILEYDLWLKGQSSNTIAISILKQIPFLEKLRSDLKSGDEEKIATIARSLFRIKEYLWSENSRIMVQLGYPTTAPNPIPQFLMTWQRAIKNIKFYRTLGGAASAKPLSSRRNGRKKKEKKNWSLGFVRQEFHGLETPRHIITPIGGVETSFVYVLSNCPIDKKHPDCFAVLVLGELIALSEGPLYNRIRGKGYAYDASLTFHLWSSVLNFNLTECSSPVKAILEFHEILREIEAETSPILTDFQIETAKASLMYQFHSGRSNATSVISGSLRAIFKGFSSMKEEREHEKDLDKVTKQHIMEVYHKYFKQFLTLDKCSLVVTTNPSSTEELVKSFSSPPFNITPNVCEIKDLLIPV